MERDKAYIQQLLARHKEGKCSPEEEKLLWLWIWQLNIYDQELFASPGQEKELKQRMRHAILKKIQGEGEQKQVIFSSIAGATGRKLVVYRYRFAVAAALLLLLAGSVIFFQQSRNLQPARSAAIFFNNDGHHIKTILLPDSSQVTLNLNASVEWREANGQRQVKLMGEAYFTIHKDALHPFVVLTDSLQTLALGTSFNIEYYGREKEIRVSLLEGRVQVGEGPVNAALDNGASIIAPGQMVCYDRQSHRQQVQKIAVDDVAAWRNGGLVFNNIPLPEALDRLAERYNLHIQYPPSLLTGKRVTAVFYRPTWQAALSNILFLQNRHYKAADTLITIY